MSLKHFQLLGITIPGQEVHKPKTNPDNNKNKEDKDPSDLSVEEEKNSSLLEVSNLNPEDQMQYALDQMMKKNYNESKNILDQIIENDLGSNGPPSQRPNRFE